MGCPDVRFYWCGLCWRREPLVQSDQTGQASDHAEGVERAAENAEQKTETEQTQIRESIEKYSHCSSDSRGDGSPSSGENLGPLVRGNT